VRVGKKVTEEAQKFLEALKEYGAALSAPVGLIGFWMGRKKAAAETTKLEADAAASKMDSMTRHFEALIDGYEARVKDLTDEIEALRDEIKELRQALDKRPRL
jgi:predicted RNase H-like nuclease (RuvC/YqgF family)